MEVIENGCCIFCSGKIVVTGRSSAIHIYKFLQKTFSCDNASLNTVKDSTFSNLDICLDCFEICNNIIKSHVNITKKSLRTASDVCFVCEQRKSNLIKIKSGSKLADLISQHYGHLGLNICTTCTFNANYSLGFKKKLLHKFPQIKSLNAIAIESDSSDESIPDKTKPHKSSKNSIAKQLKHVKSLKQLKMSSIRNVYKDQKQLYSFIPYIYIKRIKSPNAEKSPSTLTKKEVKKKFNKTLPDTPKIKKPMFKIRLKEAAKNKTGSAVKKMKETDKKFDLEKYGIKRDLKINIFKIIPGKRNINILQNISISPPTRTKAERKFLDIQKISEKNLTSSARKRKSVSFAENGNVEINETTLLKRTRSSADKNPKKSILKSPEDLKRTKFSCEESEEEADRTYFMANIELLNKRKSILCNYFSSSSDEEKVQRKEKKQKPYKRIHGNSDSSDEDINLRSKSSENEQSDKDENSDFIIEIDELTKSRIEIVTENESKTSISDNDNVLSSNENEESAKVKNNDTEKDKDDSSDVDIETDVTENPEKFNKDKSNTKKSIDNENGKSIEISSDVEKSDTAETAKNSKETKNEKIKYKPRPKSKQKRKTSDNSSDSDIELNKSTTSKLNINTKNTEDNIDSNENKSVGKRDSSDSDSTSQSKKYKARPKSKRKKTHDSSDTEDESLSSIKNKTQADSINDNEKDNNSESDGISSKKRNDENKKSKSARESCNSDSDFEQPRKKPNKDSDDISKDPFDDLLSSKPVSERRIKLGLNRTNLDDDTTDSEQNNEFKKDKNSKQDENNHSDKVNSDAESDITSENKNEVKKKNLYKPKSKQTALDNLPIDNEDNIHLQLEDNKKVSETDENDSDSIDLSSKTNIKNQENEVIDALYSDIDRDLEWIVEDEVVSDDNCQSAGNQSREKSNEVTESDSQELLEKKSDESEKTGCQTENEIEANDESQLSDSMSDNVSSRKTTKTKLPVKAKELNSIIEKYTDNPSNMCIFESGDEGDKSSEHIEVSETNSEITESSKEKDMENIDDSQSNRIENKDNENCSENTNVSSNNELVRNNEIEKNLEEIFTDDLDIAENALLQKEKSDCKENKDLSNVADNVCNKSQKNILDPASTCSTI